MLFLTDFADQAMMSPLALVVLAGLCLLGWWRAAFAWSIAIGGTFAVMLLLKAGFMLLAAEFGSDYHISPSGHVASACAVYGGLAVLLLRGIAPALVIAAVPAGAALAIGYTRLMLGFHTVPEVLTGAGVGLAGVTVLALTIGARPRLAAWPLTVAGVFTVLLLHGSHVPAEEAIQSISMSW